LKKAKEKLSGLIQKGFGATSTNNSAVLSLQMYASGGGQGIMENGDMADVPGRKEARIPESFQWWKDCN